MNFNVQDFVIIGAIIGFGTWCLMQAAKRGDRW